MNKIVHNLKKKRQQLLALSICLKSLFFHSLLCSLLYQDPQRSLYVLLHFLVLLFYILTFSTLTETSLIILVSSFLAQDILIPGLMVYFLLLERSCYIIIFFFHGIISLTGLINVLLLPFISSHKQEKDMQSFHLSSNGLGYRGQVGLAYLRASQKWGNVIEYHGTKG